MAGDVKSSLGTWHPQSSAGYCLSFVLCLRCILSLCVHWRVTQGQWQDSTPAAPCSATPTPPLPISPPFPVTPLLSLLTGQHAGPLCHLSISETAPRGASVTELGAAACCLCLDSGKVPLLPFRLLSFSPALSCSLLLPVLSFTNTDTQNDTHIQSSDSFCQLFPTSASRHKGATPPPPPQAAPTLLPPPTAPACHLWSGCQVLRLTCQAATLTVDPEKKDRNQLETDDI